MGPTTEEAIRNNCLALIVEATEVLNETHWKPWKKYNSPPDIDLLQEEIADCLAFIFNLAFEAGLDAQSLAKTLYDKQDKNMQRFP